MATERDFDRHLRSMLREVLDHESGPHPVWDESPAARRITELQNRRAHTRWSIRLLAVAALLIVSGGAALVGGGLIRPPTEVPGPTVSPQASAFSLHFCPAVSAPSAAGSGPAFDPAAMRGRIVYSTGTEILAIDPVDPAHPARINATIAGPTESLPPPFVQEPPLAAVAAALIPTSWSGDGTRLMLYSYSWPGPTVLNADGRVVSLNLSQSARVSLAPDGSSVVYSVPGGGLCVVGIDGGTPRVIELDGGEPLDGPPAWSPDGTTIAWMDFMEDSPVYGHHAYGLSLINPDGSNLRQLVTHFPNVDEGGGGLSWSPDGTRLVFWLRVPDPSPTGMITGLDPGPGDIWVINADGTGLRRITTGADDRWPSWSPDGARVAFVHNGALYTMNSDGTDPRPVGNIRPVGWVAWNAAR